MSPEYQALVVRVKEAVLKLSPEDQKQALKHFEDLKESLTNLMEAMSEAQLASSMIDQHLKKIKELGIDL